MKQSRCDIDLHVCDADLAIDIDWKSPVQLFCLRFFYPLSHPNYSQLPPPPPPHPSLSLPPKHTHTNTQNLILCVLNVFCFIFLILLSIKKNRTHDMMYNILFTVIIIV